MVSRLYQGPIKLGSQPDKQRSPPFADAPDSEIHYWRESEPPWLSLHERAASPLKRAADQRYDEHLLSGDAIWFGAPGRGYVSCTASDLSSATAKETYRSDGTPLCPTLAPARLIEGVVREESGKPVSDAEIVLTWRPTGNGLALLGNIVRSTPANSVTVLRSDAVGRFRIDRADVQAGNGPLDDFVGVLVKKEGFVPIAWRNLSHFSKNQGLYEMTLARGSSVTGQVLDAASGRPIGGAEVALGRFASLGYILALGPIDRDDGPYGSAIRFTRTKEDGSFELSASPGRWDLLVRADNRAPHQSRGLRLPPQGLDAGTIYVQPGFEIEILVRNPSGDPIPGAHVLAAGAKDEGILTEPWKRNLRHMFSDARQEEGDRSGRIRIGGLDADSAVNLYISAVGFAPEIVERHGPTDGPPLEITLQPEAVIAGRVTLGRRPVRASVSLILDQSTASKHVAATDENGSFRLGGLTSGRYSVKVNPDRPGTDEWRTSVQGTAGEVVQLDVELDPGTKSLDGQVTSESGVGLGAVVIQAQGRRTVTSSDGRYRLDGLGAEPITVTAGREGWRTLTRTVQIQGHSEIVNFEFVAHEVAGTAFWGSGSPVSGQELRFALPGSGGITARTATDGSFTARLEGGDHFVSVLAADGVRKQTLLSIDGPTSDVRIRFSNRLRIEGSVHGLTASELARLSIVAINADDLRRRSGSVDASGRFFVDHVDTGVWRVVGSVGPSGRHTEAEVLVSDDGAELDLQFERRFQLAGVVRLEGKPMRSTRVLLISDPEPAGNRSVWTRYDGAFLFTDVEKGRYQLGVGASLRQLVVNGDEQLVIDVGSGRVDGFVADPEMSAPKPGAEVLLWPRLATQAEAEQLGVLRRTFANTMGEFTFDQVPEGAWVVDVPGVGVSTVNVGAGSRTMLLIP